MSHTRVAKFAVGIGAAAMTVAFAAVGLGARQKSAADVAAAFSGTWKLNHDLSPGLKQQAAPGGGGGRGGNHIVGSDIAMAVMPRAQYGPGATTSATDRAGQSMLRSFQQVPEEIQITATETSWTTKDARGERSFPVTGKDSKIDIGGVTFTNNSKWDKMTLKQRLIFSETSVDVTWELVNDGKRLNYKIATHNLDVNAGAPGAYPEIKAVFDKQ